MKAVLTITRRGTVTLEAELRDHLGLKAGGLLTVETTPDGILLRSATRRPVEIYSDERIREFEESEAELAARGTGLDSSSGSVLGPRDEYPPRRKTLPRNEGLVNLLLACPTKGWFKPLDRTEPTDVIPVAST